MGKKFFSRYPEKKPLLYDLKFKLYTDRMWNEYQAKLLEKDVHPCEVTDPRDLGYASVLSTPGVPQRVPEDDVYRFKKAALDARYSYRDRTSVPNPFPRHRASSPHVMAEVQSQKPRVAPSARPEFDLKRSPTEFMTAAQRDAYWSSRRRQIADTCEWEQEKKLEEDRKMATDDLVKRLQETQRAANGRDPRPVELTPDLLMMTYTCG